MGSHPLPNQWVDVAISFSGVEHDGLGRYGDPVNPDGDLAAVREIRRCLKPHGVLLLAVPSCHRDTVFFPGHRVYGPVRLPRLIAGFRLLARAWNAPWYRNHVITGGLERAGDRPPLWGGNCRNWAWQHVLVLERLEGRAGDS